MTAVPERRKEDHVRICLRGEVEGPGTTGLERVSLRPAPAIVPADAVDLRTSFLGCPVRMPLMIASMSGGWGLGRALNLALAGLAERWGVPFSVGSMRPALEDPRRMADYDVKSCAPQVPVLGNIGVWQLRDPDLAARCLAACDALGFDALMVHVNPAHEEAQPEGERDLDGAMEVLSRFAGAASLPILVKEVGHGFTPEALGALAAMPIQGLDVAGAGGTNWPLVEAARIPAGTPAWQRAVALGAAGRDTCSTLMDAAPLFADRMLIAGGGIRTGEDIAKCLALGADVASVAAPILRQLCFEDQAGELVVREDGADPWFAHIEGSLRGAFGLAGAASVAEMRDFGRVVFHA